MDFGNLLGRVLDTGNQILNTPGKKLAAGGAAAGILFTETGRDLAGAAVKYGGIAALGALALQAWQKNQAANAAQPAGAAEAGGSFLPPQAAPTAALPPPEADQHARLMLSAMVNAAKSDGQIDAEEQAAIFGRARDMNLTNEEQLFLMGELSKPFDIEPIVRGATSPELAVEVYTASAIAVGAASPAESSYLHILASRLNLPQGLTAEIQKRLSGQAAPA